MPSFKPKSVKQIVVNEKSATTLDGKHTQMLKKFENNEKIVIPSIEKEILNLKERLNQSEDSSMTNKSDNNTKSILLRIKKLENKMNKIKNEKNEYFLQNASYIFDYFEQKKNLEDGQSKTTKLNAFFNLAPKTQKPLELCTDAVKKYLRNIDENFLDIEEFVIPVDFCQSCKEGELIPIEHDGIIVCNKCSSTIKYLVENEKPSYKEPPKEVCFYAYKRINHFREILAQFQAKETTFIPDEVLEGIRLQAKKERIPLEPQWFTNAKAKEILKKLGLNRYYEHIPYIKDKLGIKPPVMSPELEEVLCNLFMALQAPYAKCCPDDRVNFLNYYYTGYKLCELLEQYEFLPYFPMLKDPEKRLEQDEIWKKMCAELDWPFIDTHDRQINKYNPWE